ncbi:MAG: hypothetical protein Alis3KO_03130 [Aliiglaciecola sp.]
MPSESVKQPASTPNRKWWVYAILLVLVLGVLAYYGLQSRKDRSSNHDYYRVLYEASNSFNENLIKLDSMHRYKEGVSSIRSLLPSYSREAISNAKQLAAKSFKYEIVGQSLVVSSKESPEFSAKLAFEDILPDPKKGFSQYLFANENGDVLARVGGERTISIVELSSINQQIQRKNKQFQLNFTDPEEQQSTGTRVPLPSYSNHVDMKISYGDFRVYVFPFSLATPLDQKNESKTSVLDRLYLVGLLPQDKLASRGSDDWNISVLVVTVISLFFIWCMLRLYLLPKNQSITRSYRVMTNAASYLFYIVIIAMTLAYFQKSLLQIEKDDLARQYSQYLSQNFAKDLGDVFSQLASYRDFYLGILKALKDLPDKPEQYTSYPQTEIQNFNETIGAAIVTLDSKSCAGGENASSMPSMASTAYKKYPIKIDCNAKDGKSLDVDISLNDHAISVMQQAYTSTKSRTTTLDFYSNNQLVELEPEKSLETSIDPLAKRDPKSILSVFALNREGSSVLPSMNFQESNSLPRTVNLSHRNYYKKVRDHQGWDLTLPVSKTDPTEEYVQFNNVYIQRLLNVNNGTRGTTISMPIYDHSKTQKANFDYIIGADVILPSVTLGQAPPYDFIYMVVDRSSGEVLFHNDSNRSLVENLYFSGDTRSPLSKWLRAGLDHYPELGNDLITGSYHGQAGRFAVTNTAVDKWAVVVFYPDDSLDTFMTNQFLYVASTFAVLIASMIAIIYGVRHFVWTSTLKRKLKLPAKLNVRLVMLVSSVLFSAGYSLYIIGFNLEDLIFYQNQWNWSVWIPVVGLLIATFVVYKGCYNHFCYPLNDVNQNTVHTATLGSRRLIIAVLIAVGIHFVYLQKTADAPQKSLDFHYQQLACNWLNYERQELVTIGLSRYPNSITSTRIAPMDLLPLNPSWRARLIGESTHKSATGLDRNQSAPSSSQQLCTNHSTQVTPDDYPSLGSVFGATYMWQWINIYLLDKDLATGYQPYQTFTDEQHFKNGVTTKLITSTLLFAGLLSLIMWFWFRYNVRVLWNKLYCPERFLQHVQRLTQSVNTLEFEERNQNLKIECDTVKLNGIGLALLLRTMTYNQDKHSDRLLAGFEELFEKSPCLQKFSKEGSFLPNLKLNLKKDPDTQLLHLELWDIETCLEKSGFRQLLLDLIMEFKSLTLSNQLASFTIFAGFHSLQRVKMKDPLMLDHSSILDHSEYLSWAECLMDFIVIVPESFQQGIDWQLLHEEVAAFPELQFLDRPLPEQSDEDGWQYVWKRDEEANLESRWTTINYILLNAEALYRFKWESCSSAEKLALLNLAKQQRLNPANTQMIEHLALNGLITVRKGHLDIINQSFAHFVLHAETNATLNRLVQHGEAGIWKNYKIPLGVMIVLIIGGIALTSGESVYIIAASVAGVLGTIASVTNSANLLRGQLKD